MTSHGIRQQDLRLRCFELLYRGHSTHAFCTCWTLFESCTWRRVLSSFQTAEKVRWDTSEEVEDHELMMPGDNLMVSRLPREMPQEERGEVWCHLVSGEHGGWQCMNQRTSWGVLIKMYCGHFYLPLHIWRKISTNYSKFNSKNKFVYLTHICKSQYVVR